MARYITDSDTIEVEETGQNLQFNVIPSSIISSDIDAANGENVASSIKLIKDLNTFSANEIDTGMTWYDGKKIYRKVFTGNRSGNAETVISYSNVNVDSITNITPLLYSDNNALIYTAPYYNTSDDNWRIYTNLGNKRINLNCGSSYPGRNGKYIVIMEYTKTS